MAALIELPLAAQIGLEFGERAGKRLAGGCVGVDTLLVAFSATLLAFSSC